jgi:hypothetical protein
MVIVVGILARVRSNILAVGYYPVALRTHHVSVSRKKRKSRILT